MIEEKKQKNNKVIKTIALLGLFLMVFGISYALFKVTLNGSKVNKIKSGKMELLLTERNANVNEPNGIAINIENAIPMSDEDGKTQEDKYEFDILNRGDVNAKYEMYVDVESSSTLSPNFVKAYLELDGEAVSEPITLGSITPDAKGGYKIETGVVAKGYRNGYSLRLFLKEETELDDVKIDEDTYREFNAKIRVEGTQLTSVENPYRQGSAAYKIVNDATVINKNNTVPMMGFDPTEEASGLYRYTDSEGTTTYAYRGNVENNYVSFGGQIWRIVRTLEDGSVRLILDDRIGSGYLSNGVENSSNCYVYNHLYDDPKYVDYATSDIKETVDDWYSKTLADYDNKIATSTYCNDKSEEPNTDYSNYLINNEGYTKVFSFYRRIDLGDFDIIGENYCKDEECDEIDEESFLKDTKTAKFQASISCREADKVKAKVALLTADEYILAGGAIWAGDYNYLVKSGIRWTMTPAFFSGEKAEIIDLDYGTRDNNHVDSCESIFPVITLKSIVAISGGNGTSSEPYIIK